MKINPLSPRARRERAPKSKRHQPPGRTRLAATFREFLCVLSISVLTAVFVMPLASQAEQRKGLGMWVWSNSSFLTQEARQQLVRFCLKHRITHLDVHIKMTHDGSDPILKDSEAFKDLIVLAGQHNITIAALRGHPKMFFADNHERTLRELRAMVAFSETLPEDTLFKGIKYDVEPYCTKKWKAGGRSFTQ